MEDSTQKRAGEPLEVPQRRRGRPSRRKLEPIPARPLIPRPGRKLEPIPPRPLLPRPVDPTPSSSNVDFFSIASSHPTLSSSTIKSFSLAPSHPTPLSLTVDLSSVASSRRRLDPASLRPLIPTVDPILSSSNNLVVTTASHATDNSSLSDIHSRRRRPRMQMTPTSETTPTLVPGSQSQSPVKLVSLVDDFQQRKEAWLRFPPPLDNETTRAAIHRYQVHTDDATMHLNHVCGSCSRFTHPSELKIIPKDNPMVATASATGYLSLDQFDSCECLSQSYTFCKECWKRITEGKLPKYSISNGMSQLCCQNYPLALENLSIAEEAVIARAHPVVTILKLRPNNRFNPGAYRGIRGHAVLLPQNPGPLLTLLPSDLAALGDVVRIIWLESTSSQRKDLQKFVSVRKHRIIEVLEWLKAHNPLYIDISINYPLLSTWEDEFIPQGITDHLVLCDPDSQEREGYAASLRDDNFENNLDAAIAETEIEADQLHSGCVYSDIDDGRQNPTLKLLSAIDNIKSGTTFT